MLQSTGLESLIVQRRRAQVQDPHHVDSQRPQERPRPEQASWKGNAIRPARSRSCQEAAMQGQGPSMAFIRWIPHLS